METKFEEVFLKKYAGVARSVFLRLEEKEEIRARLVEEIKAGPIKSFPVDEEVSLFFRVGQAVRRLLIA